MKRTIAPLPLSVILSMTGALGFAGVAAGQPRDAGQSPSATVQRTAQPTTPSIEEQTRRINVLQRGPTIDLDFRGGTFSAFLKAVQDAAAPTPVNIMTSPEAGSQEAPAIRLTGVTVDTALRSVGKVLEARRWFVEVKSMAQTGDEVPTFFLQALPPPTAGTAASPGSDQIELRVFSVRDLIEPPPGMSGSGLSIPLPAVTSALELLQDQSPFKGAPAEVKLHEQSGTLLVRGNEAQILQVQQLLESMKGEMTARRQMATVQLAHSAERAAAAEEAKAKLRGLEIERQSLEHEIADAQRRFRMTEEMGKSGSATPQDLESARARLSEAESKLSAKRVEYDRLRAELEGVLNLAGGPGGTVGSPDARLVVYDARDLKSRIKEIDTFLDRMRALGGGELPRVQIFTPGSNADGQGDKCGTPNLIIVATREQHEVIEEVLKMLRGDAPGNVVEQKK